MMRIDEHHRKQCHVVGGRYGHKHQDFGRQPITAFHRRREYALHKPIRARASEKHGRERDESQGHQEVRDDAVAVKPSILRPHGRHAADRQQHDAGAKPRKATAHGGFEFLDV